MDMPYSAVAANEWAGLQFREDSVEWIMAKRGKLAANPKTCAIDPLVSEAFVRDCAAARENYQTFEFAYRLLRPDDLTYLREQSAAYKRAVLAVQELIEPVVRSTCPVCPYGTCCRLSTPELSIYIARSVGGFVLTDYLLVRCEVELPAPDFANTRLNLCPFWDNGCRLRPDCRSLLCLQYFCESLRHELDMDLVNKKIAEVQAILENFSMNRLLKKKR